MSKNLTLAPVAVQAAPLVLGRHTLDQLCGGLGDRCRRRCVRGAGARSPARRARGPARPPRAAASRTVSRWAGRIVLDRAEVGEREALGLPGLDRSDRVQPGLDVDVRRRRGGDDQVGRRNAHRGDVADEGRAALLVQVADVVRGVARACRRRACRAGSRRRPAVARWPRAPARSLPRAAPSHRRRGARRWPAGARGRSGAGRRARGRRPRARASGAPAPRSPRHGRGGCGSAAAPAAARRRAPPAGSPSKTAGPGSTSMPSTSQQPITCGRPRCMTSMTRIALGGSLRPPGPGSARRLPASAACPPPCRAGRSRARGWPSRGWPRR